MSEAKDAWWVPFYDELLVTMLLERDDASAVHATTDFLVEQLALSPGARVFDQCCGIGSVAIPLAARGMHVIGVDQAAAYVARADRDAAAAKVSAKFHVGDAFRFVATPPVDGAFNWWTSFGYAADDATNASMLARAFESLRSGGRFVLDTMNVAGVLRGFARAVVDRRTTPRGELVLLRESDVDLAAGVMRKCWTYLVPDGARVVHESAVRLYLPHTLGAMLRDVGFEDVVFFGGVRGERLTIDSPRCIVLARRPA